MSSPETLTKVQQILNEVKVSTVCTSLDDSLALKVVRFLICKSVIVKHDQKNKKSSAQLRATAQLGRPRILAAGQKETQPTSFILQHAVR